MDGKQRIAQSSAVLLTVIVSLLLFCLWSSLPLNASPENIAFQPGTLLDEVGRLNHSVSAKKVIEWKTELKTEHPTAERSAWLHLWLGEWELVQNEQPEQARWHFRQAQHLTNPQNFCYGLAAYDSAISLFYEGAYDDASDAFLTLLRPKHGFPGYDRRTCALWLRHAQACAGYHATHAKLGIPEPPRLDPFCGAASLAACLQSLSLPYDRASVRKVCRVTGEGSSLQDVLNAGRKLGLNARALTADDQGLQALPKPLVAYVEQDHFVALVRADARGVSYLCSDCGAWPGGQVDLTWTQWHVLNPGIYIAVTKAGSGPDQLIQAALTAPAQKSGKQPVRLSYGGPLSALHLNVHTAFSVSLTRLKGHIVDYLATQTACGLKPESLHCPGYIQCPMLSPASGGCDGPSGGDPVNLATGEEEYKPQPDLIVHCPISATGPTNSPSIVWSRIYNSLRAPDSTGQQYESKDFGVGWSHSYNVIIYDPDGSNPTFHTRYLIMPNGARIPFYTTNPMAGTDDLGACSFDKGVPLHLVWNHSGQFIVTLPNRTQWLFVPNIIAGQFVLSTITDRNGNFLVLQYQNGLLSTIVGNNANFPLLTIYRNADQSIDHVTDIYGHIVYYHETTLNNTVGTSYPDFDKTSLELTNVSQVISDSSASPFQTGGNTFQVGKSRWTYDYSLVSNGDPTGLPSPQTQQFPFLHSITVPSPVNGLADTTVITYQPTTCAVSTIADANNNVTTITSTSTYNSNVQVKNSSGAILRNSTYTFDASMRQLTETDNNNNVIATYVYNDTNDPNLPSAMSDADGNRWSFVWDSDGNLHQRTSPRGTVTKYAWRFLTTFKPGGSTSDDQEGSAAPYLGELISVKTGNKTKTSFDYYEPSGNIHHVYSPKPGANGTVSAEGPTVTTTFAFDGWSNLTSITTPGNPATVSGGVDQGIKTTFNYTQDSNYDSNGNPGSYTVALPERVGLPLTMTDNVGRTSHFRYDLAGHLVIRIDPFGNKTTYSYVLPNSPSGLLSDQLQQVTLPATGQSGSGSGALHYTYQYDGGPLVSAALSDESGAVIRQTNYSYGPEGELISLSGSVEPVTYFYDALYRLSALQDGDGHLTHYYYKAAGYLDSVTYPGYYGSTPVYNSGLDSWSNISGPDSMHFAYDPAGYLTKRIDGKGVETDYLRVDPVTGMTEPGSLVRTIHSLHGELPDISLSYDAYDRLVSMQNETGSTLYGPTIGATHYTGYDDLDNPLNIQTSYSGMGSSPLLTYAYNADGSRSSLAVSAVGSLSYSYDILGRLISLNNMSNETTQWSYPYTAGSGTSQVIQTLNNGLKTTSIFNPLGLLVDKKNQVSASLISDFSSPQSVPQHGYDGAGNMISMTATIPTGTLGAAFSGTTTYTYDNGQTATAGLNRGQLTNESTTRNGTSVNAFSYDGAENPITSAGIGFDFNLDNQALALFDGNGNPMTFRNGPLTFDAQNRLIGAATQPPSHVVALAMGSDNKCRLLWSNPDGSITLRIVNSSGSYTAFNYGPFAHYTATALSVDPSGLTHILWNKSDGGLSLWVLNTANNTYTHHEYAPSPDVHGLWTATSIAVGTNGRTYVLWCRADGQISLWNINDSDQSGTYAHTEYGPFTDLSGKSIYAARSLAVDGSNYLHILWNDLANNSISLWVLNPITGTYTYKNYGPYAGYTAGAISVGIWSGSDNHTHVLWNGPGGIQSFWSEDDASSGPNNYTHYEYGPISGWISCGLSVGPDGLTHILWSRTDGHAAVWTQNSSSGSYTSLEEDGPVAPTTSTVTMAYRGDGLRAWKTSSLGTSYYLYDGDLPLCEYNSNGGATAVNTFGAMGLVSRVVTSGDTFYAFDERGNVAERLSSSGAVQSADLYDAYGNRTSTSTVADVWGFGAQAGYYTDTETGLLLLTNRYYDPAQGRLLTRDPSGYAGGINLYNYVQNNPGNSWDPLGLSSDDDMGPSNWDAAVAGFNVGFNGVRSAFSFGFYDGGDARCDPDFGTSVALAGIGRDALITAATLGAGEGLVGVGRGGEAVEEGAEAEEGAAEAVEDGCPGRCFTAATPVQMADGTTKPISQVQVGDQVKSRDPQTGQEEAKTVTATIKRLAPAVVTVTLTDPQVHQVVETLTCTPEHPLYVQSQGWVEAGSLGIGTSIISRAGPALSVQSVTWQRNKASEKSSALGGYTVYNLTVEDDHTFFVGVASGGTWVHNVCLRLRYKSGWSEDQVSAADEKVSGLNELAENGQLRVQAAPTQRGTVSASRIWRRNGNYIPPGSDVDHTIDLQFGGADDITNMNTLDSSVNKSLGPQIERQIRGLASGTHIHEVTIGW